MRLLHHVTVTISASNRRLAVEFPSPIPVASLIRAGSAHDNRLFPVVLDDLKRCKVLRTEDTVIRDEGYSAYDTYAVGVRDYEVVSLIFPKKTFDTGKLLRGMNYPLLVFSHHDHRKTQQMYKAFMCKMLPLLEQWEEFPSIRSLFEDLLKLGREASFPGAVRRYSRLLVTKCVVLNVLLSMTVVFAPG